MRKVSNRTQSDTRSSSVGQDRDSGNPDEKFANIKNANKKIRLLDTLRHYGFKIEKNHQRQSWSANITCPLPTHKAARERTSSFGYNFVSDHCHCFSGETRVLTKSGTFYIRDLIGQTHLVLGKDGNWVDGVFKSYGTQQLFKITLAKNNNIKVIYATDGHRWFVYNPNDQREVLTKELIKNQRLVSVYPNDKTNIKNEDWIVKSVDETESFEEVYCAEVEDGNAFALEDNILTGNCFGCGFTGRAVEFIAAYEGVTRSSVADSILSQYGEDLSSDLKDYGDDYKDDITPILLMGSKYLQEQISSNKHNPKKLKEIEKLIWWVDFYIMKTPSDQVKAEDLKYRIDRIKELIDEAI